MAVISITVPNLILPDVLAAMEQTWKRDAQRIEPTYDTLTDAAKLETCIRAELRVRKANKDREEAERTARAAVKEPTL